MTLGMDSQQLESYVPVYDVVPEKWEEARPFLVEILKKITNAVNIREIGWFLDEELLSGQAFIPGIPPAGNSSPSQFRQILRKVVDFGALPNTGLKTVPHGITFDSNFTLTNLYGASTDPNALLAIGLGHAASSPNQIELYLTSTTINVVTGSNRSNFTRTFIIIEYLQEL